MSKTTTQTDEYQAEEYLSLTRFLNHFGYDDAAIETLDGTLKVQYKDYVNNANRKVESALFPYSDRS